MIKKLILSLGIGAMALGASACNTVRGAAADVESVGDCVDGKSGNC